MPEGLIDATGSGFPARVGSTNRLWTDSEITINDDPISASNPVPVTSVHHTSKDLEGNGFTTVGTTAVEIPFSGTTESIIISSAITNIGTIYVGKSGVQSTGSNAIAFLDTAESLTMDYDDATNPFYVVSDTAAQSVMAGALL